MNQNVDRELAWDDEIVNDGPDFVLLPEGDYNFTVANFERARFQGSAKLPACNQAKLEVIIHCPENGDQTISHNLFLHTKTEGFLSEFFTGIGQKKKGEPLRMDWNKVVGSKGRCQLEHNKYMSKGEERVNNQIKKFYPYEDYLKHQQSGNAGQFQQNQPRQQQQNQAPFPTQQPQQPQQTNTGFTQGQF